MIQIRYMANVSIIQRILIKIAVIGLLFGLLHCGPTNKITELPPAIKEEKFAKLYPQKQRKWEASGITADSHHLYIIFDNAPILSRLNHSLQNPQLFTFAGKGNDFEAITRIDSGYAIAVETKKHQNRLMAEIIFLNPDFSRRANVGVDIDFNHKNKGIEGLVHIQRGGREYLLALCEAGGCRKKSKGRGTIYVLEKYANHLNPIQKILLPKKLPFLDYSGMDVHAGNIAVVSQESSLLWIGQLSMTNWQIRHKSLWSFPRRGSKKKYCNIEGVVWLDNRHLAVVSDKAKKNKKHCQQKSESIHIFELPQEKE